MAEATQTSLGTVKLAGDLSGDANSPQLPASGVTAGSYAFPTVAVNLKGLVTSISAGVNASIVFNVPAATSTVPGTITVGSGLTMVGTALTAPLATSTTPGIVKPGNGLIMSATPGVLAIDSTKFVSISGGATFTGAVTTLKAAYNITGTTVLNLSLSNVHDCTLTGNVTLSVPTNFGLGGTYFIFLNQDATGGRTLTFNSVFKFTAGSPALVTTPNAINMIRVVVKSATEFITTVYPNFT